MSSASPDASDRKPTRRAGRKAPTLRPATNTSVTAGGRVVNHQIAKGGCYPIKLNVEMWLINRSTHDMGIQKF